MISNQSVSTANDLRSNTDSAPVTMSNSDNLNFTLSDFERSVTDLSGAKDLREIYNDLPPILSDGVNILTDSNDKEVFLYSAIGCISSVLPNIYGIYDGKRVYPNLFAYILGAAGSGKGAMDYAKTLVKTIHFAIKSSSPKNDDGEPIKGKERRLFLPANVSSAGMYEMLETNDGKGLMIESEGDTLANVLKSDYGNYSDLARKGFHHEGVSHKRTTGGTDIDIPEPRLSIVLSSTFGQFLSLVPNAENGLFSRFLLCEIESSDTFRNPFESSKRAYKGTFEALADVLLVKFGELTRSPDIEIKLTQSQQNRFLEMFGTWKKDTRLMYDTKDLDGSIHRLGLIMFRICMIFSVLRSDLNVIDTIECSDIDFENALKIVEICKNKAFDVFLRLPPSAVAKTAKTAKLGERTERIEKILELKRNGMSLQKIAVTMDTTKSNIQDTLRRYS